MTTAKKPRSLPPNVDAALAALDAKGVSGAANCRQVAMDVRDAARILVTVNPAGHNKDFDKALRAAHQLGLRRRGDAELLLRVHGADGKALETRAKKAYLGTVRGALAHDIMANTEHYYAMTSACVVAALVVTVTVCKFMPTNPYARIIRTPAWVCVKIAVAALFVSSIWSTYELSKAAAKLGHRKAGDAMKYVRLPVAATCIAVGTAMSRSAPYMFVVGCGAAAFLLRRVPIKV